MIISRRRKAQVLPVLVLLGLLSLLAPAPLAFAGTQPPSQCSGYYYTVKLGDTWFKISKRVGASMETLKAANPQAVRPRDLIYAREQLCIPAGGAVEQHGYWYQVRPGDTWGTVARRTGLTVQELLSANPRLVNRRLWLYIGQVVWVPALPPEGQAAVTPGAPVAAPAATETAAPTSVPPTPTPVPTATSVPPTPTPVPTATSVPPTPTPVPTATSVPPTPTLVPTSSPTLVPPTLPPSTATASPTPLPPLPTAGVPELTATPTPASRAEGAPAQTPTLVSTTTATPTVVLPPIPADCPKTLAAYEGALAAYLNKAGNTPDKLSNWLVLCRTADKGAKAVTVAPITAPKSSDVVVVVRDPAPQTAQPVGDLLVYQKGAKGYTLLYKHEGQGRIDLIQAADINADGMFDLVYSDTGCGAHTCFGTLYVDSWDGKAFRDWITGEPTMAYPDYAIKDVTPAGQGSEILVHGGVIASVGAGPQRAWTETYISPKGGAYVLQSQVYDPSTCLYFKVADANRAFDSWALQGFDPAIEAYKAAIADTTATACGTIKDEVSTLRDFARFRLIVADVAAGYASDSNGVAGQITNTALAGAAVTFLKSYQDNTSVIQACRDTTKYAEKNPASWQFLADWGYANPSFTAQNLCPLD